VGKYLGLAGTLAINTVAMAAGLYLAMLVMGEHLGRADANVLVGIYFILLEFFVIIGLALLFSSFSTPLLSALFSLCVFVAGTFAGDLRAFAAMAHGPERWLALVTSYILPNLSSLNVITRVAHDQLISARLVGYNSLYALLYVIVTVCGAMLIFTRRNLK
jgi:ABC-type transport system involved in multi-copper enzyme maturation permease subunit